MPTNHISDCLSGLYKYETASSHKKEGERFEAGRRGTLGALTATAAATGSARPAATADAAASDASAPPRPLTKSLSVPWRAVTCRYVPSSGVQV